MRNISYAGSFKSVHAEASYTRESHELKNLELILYSSFCIAYNSLQRETILKHIAYEMFPSTWSCSHYLSPTQSVQPFSIMTLECCSVLVLALECLQHTNITRDKNNGYRYLPPRLRTIRHDGKSCT